MSHSPVPSSIFDLSFFHSLSCIKSKSRWSRLLPFFSLANRHSKLVMLQSKQVISQMLLALQLSAIFSYAAPAGLGNRKMDNHISSFPSPTRPTTLNDALKDERQPLSTRQDAKGKDKVETSVVKDPSKVSSEARARAAKGSSNSNQSLNNDWIHTVKAKGDQTRSTLNNAKEKSMRDVAKQWNKPV
jgi:hypothetical protein